MRGVGDATPDEKDPRPQGAGAPFNGRQSPGHGPCPKIYAGLGDNTVKHLRDTSVRRPPIDKTWERGCIFQGTPRPGGWGFLLGVSFTALMSLFRRKKGADRSRRPRQVTRATRVITSSSLNTS